jgi:hypothetical protein
MLMAPSCTTLAAGFEHSRSERRGGVVRRTAAGILIGSAAVMQART